MKSIASICALAAMILAGCGSGSPGSFDGQDASGGGAGGHVGSGGANGGQSGSAAAGTISGSSSGGSSGSTASSGSSGTTATNGGGSGSSTTTGTPGANTLTGQRAFTVAYAYGEAQSYQFNAQPWVPYQFTLTFAQDDTMSGCGFQNLPPGGGQTFGITFSSPVAYDQDLYPNGGVAPGQYPVGDGGISAELSGPIPGGDGDFHDPAVSGQLTLISFSSNPSDGTLVRATGAFDLVIRARDNSTSDLSGSFDVGGCP